VADAARAARDERRSRQPRVGARRARRARHRPLWPRAPDVRRLPAAAARARARARAGPLTPPRRAALRRHPPRRRPLSPHLTIYTFKENMITSVLFRGTGIAMTLGLGAFAIAAPFVLTPSRPWRSYVASLQSVPLANAIVKFGVAFPFAYHAIGGVRHLLWDNIIGHTPELARKSGPAIVAAGVVVGVVAAVYESGE